MKKAIFYNGNTKFNILVPESIDEKYRGMKIFKTEKAVENAGYDGMFFEFKSDIDYMTMNGMQFPLKMIFLDNDSKWLKEIKTNIEDDNIPIPKDAKSCLELLKGLSFNKDLVNRIEISDDREQRFKKLSNLLREVIYGN